MRARYFSLCLGSKKGTTMTKTNFDITARAIETVDSIIFLAEKRYIASITKKICKESQCPLPAKLIRIRGLHAYIKTCSGALLILFKNFANSTIERRSNTKKIAFNERTEWET
ncbi:MAG: hypothetical protein SCALA701_36190 [Candidatus Scalindua sp.]|nr:MAG: hypothetical protein SCALA701_36190 [Candidatus Scalindua sp.]